VRGCPTGLLAALAALVLGLLVASAKAEFDAQEAGFEQLSANIVLLDRMLAHYGPETKDVRAALHGTVIAMMDDLWPGEGAPAAGMDAADITSHADKLLPRFAIWRRPPMPSGPCRRKHCRRPPTWRALAGN
jgi:hypothetical protein